MHLSYLGNDLLAMQGKSYRNIQTGPPATIIRNCCMLQCLGNHRTCVSASNWSDHATTSRPLARMGELKGRTSIRASRVERLRTNRLRFSATWEEYEPSKLSVAYI